MEIRKELWRIVWAGLVVVIIGSGCKPDPANPTKEKYNPVITNILNRKSVRQYTERPVEEEKVELLLRAGMASPSARDLRPWEFIVIKNRPTLDSLAAALPFGKMLAQAPLAIVVCGDTVRSERLWVEDCAMVAQNILLAAESLNLGAVFTAVYPYPDRLKAVNKYTRLPAHIVPLTIIPVGYPQGKQTPKDKFDAKKIHYETYSHR
ncbi:nitroreductase family protein [Parabacteroides pacaensis]|uniref:nitroreductase family protein n=1 Tax=Parabacteroides pacaensis TaxID=2086575 RepID=UPI000D0E7307|nr:nitroreductase family protein [Parabacteroides pacaensis]